MKVNDETTSEENQTLLDHTKAPSLSSNIFKFLKYILLFTLLFRLAYLFFSVEIEPLLSKSKERSGPSSIINGMNPSFKASSDDLFCPEEYVKQVRQEYKNKATTQPDKYTLVVSTYNRDNELIKNVDHWLSCPRVHQVQVVWHDPHRDPPPILAQMEQEYNCSVEIESEEGQSTFIHSPRLLIRPQEKDLLTNRFKIPDGGFETDAVFNIDDDAVIDCRLMTGAFEKWKELGEYSMVGFEPRQITWKGEGQGYYWYASCEEDSCEYNTLWPTKGAFLHRDFYNHFFEDEYVTVRKLVEKYFTGEDILMAFIHFKTHMDKYDKPPPILSVQASPGFERRYFDKKNRFSVFERLLFLPETLFVKTGADEVKSLGWRSSMFRAKVHSGISTIAEEKVIPKPPMIDSWYFMYPNETGFEARDVCSDKELYSALECSTKYSLTPVSTHDAEIMVCVIGLLGFTIIFGVKAYISHRRKLMQFEQVRMRKISVGSPSELVATSVAIGGDV
eukprot:snap_masked-scaffold_1-processed-gene-26.34-mRNA-1 protein AED:1.00 eAED:1.00 QI:0/-1/0/0/-1/1/1/0/503